MSPPTLGEATLHALVLLARGDAALWEIIGLSFRVSAAAIAMAAAPAMLAAFLLAHLAFPGRRLLISLFSTLLSLPAVVVGLSVYLLLSRHGPLGDWRLLFTQSAMVLAQIVLAFPILVAMSHAAFQAADRRAWETARTLGLSRLRSFFLVLGEVRFALLAAILAAFGRVIAEVGASMMVGGNILHHTRNIPTAIALETAKGNFAQGIALGIVLLLLAFALNAALQYVQGRGNLSV